MKMDRQSIIVLFLLQYLNLCSLYAQSGADANKILWQKEFDAGEGICSAPHDISISPDGNALYITGTSFRPKVYSEGKFWLWKIDTNGRIIKKNVLTEADKNIASASAIGYGSWITRGLNVSTDGKIFAAGKFKDKNQSFLQINNEGTNKYIKSIYDNNSSAGKLIWRMISMPDGNFLLLGKNDSGNALIVKLSASGDKLWEKTYKLGKLSFFSDGVSVNANGDFTVVGWSSEYSGEIALTKTSNIWLLKCNSEGEKLLEITFPGGSPSGYKSPQICFLESGVLIVIYDKGSTLTTTEYNIDAFNLELKKIWNKFVVTSENNLPIYIRMKAFKGGFAIAYSTNMYNIRIHRYDNEGEETQVVFLDKINGFGEFGFECTKQKAFIVMPTIPENRDYITKTNIIAVKID
ncbi:MAG: hypothetical protein PHP01_02265 [Phycisphaerae bacterium]|nr:hypothetical protein [Phycisphaerae bacterium]